MARKLEVPAEETSELMTEAWKHWEGRTINDEFQLHQYLSGSERSAVFLAGQPGEPCQFAIKLVPAEAANAERQLARWRLVERLSHPHLIRMLRTGCCQLDSATFVFAVMEYAEENLAQVLPQRPLTPAEVLEMLAPTLGALAYLHNQGFVHGCLQPANVMALKDQIKLASDNLVRANEPALDRNQPSVYEAPETVSGGFSAAADVWSLGVMLVEVLTQRLPVWRKKDQEDPVLPENLPAPFAEVVRGCLRRDPRQRCTLADIAMRLNLTLPSPRKQQMTGSPVASTKKRFQIFLMAMGTAAFLFLAVLAGTRLLHRQPRAPQVTSVVASQQPKLGNTGHSLQKAGGQSSLGASHGASASNVKPSPASPRVGTSSVASNRLVQEGEVIHQVLPDVPQKAMNTIHGTLRVSVRVQVDASGNVVGADFDTPGPSQYFARLAMQAAKSWTFAPHPQEREFVIHFDFTNAETRAFATRAGR